MTVKALFVWSMSRSSFNLRRWVWLGRSSLALLLPRIALLLKARLVLYSHHMAGTSAFLDVSLCCFKHATQLIPTLLRPMHMVVRDEVPISRRKRRKNEISGQLLAQWEAQLLQPLSVTNHLDYVWSYCCAFC